VRNSHIEFTEVKTKKARRRLAMSRFSSKIHKLGVSAWHLFCDDHCVISLFFVEPHDPFTRPRRLTCLFCLILGTLAINAVFYGKAGDSITSRIVTGVVTGILLFPAKVMFVYIFTKVGPALAKRFGPQPPSILKAGDIPPPVHRKSVWMEEPPILAPPPEHKSKRWSLSFIGRKNSIEPYIVSDIDKQPSDGDLLAGTQLPYNHNNDHHNDLPVMNNNRRASLGVKQLLRIQLNQAQGRVHPLPESLERSIVRVQAYVRGYQERERLRKMGIQPRSHAHHKDTPLERAIEVSKPVTRANLVLAPRMPHFIRGNMPVDSKEQFSSILLPEQDTSSSSSSSSLNQPRRSAELNSPVEPDTRNPIITTTTTKKGPVAPPMTPCAFPLPRRSYTTTQDKTMTTVNRFRPQIRGDTIVAMERGLGQDAEEEKEEIEEEFPPVYNVPPIRSGREPTVALAVRTVQRIFRGYIARKRCALQGMKRWRHLLPLPPAPPPPAFGECQRPRRRVLSALAGLSQRPVGGPESDSNEATATATAVVGRPHFLHPTFNHEAEIAASKIQAAWRGHRFRETSLEAQVVKAAVARKRRRVRREKEISKLQEKRKKGNILEKLTARAELSRMKTHGKQPHAPLPWYFSHFGYIFCYLFLAIMTYLAVMFGVKFTHDTNLAWLQTTAISTAQDVILTEPFVLMFAAFREVFLPHLELLVEGIVAAKENMVGD